MPRRFCRLPQGFSEAIASDCKNRHQHLNRREVFELEKSGDIEFFDHHPITLLPRYVDRVHKTQRTHLSAPIIQRAAGVADPRERAWASEKVEGYGADKRAFQRLYSGTKYIALPRVVWNSEGIFVNCDPPPKGSLITVGLKPPTPDARHAASEYWRIQFLWRDKVSSDGSQAGLVRPNVPRKMIQSVMGKSEVALRHLDEAWREIVEKYLAGPYSEELNRLKAGDLPSMIVGKTLAAYLFTPTQSNQK
jgi:hypothetical protein